MLATLLVLSVEQRAMSQGMWEASGGCERQETNSPLEPVGGTNLADTCLKLSETQGRLLTYRTIHEYTCMWLSGKESACNVGDMGSIPGLGRSPGEGIGYPLQYSWASRVAQLVKNPLAMRETWVQPLGWEGPLEKGKAVHSSILAWRIPWAV